MNGADDDSRPSIAVDWISRILAAAAAMLLPGLAGHWLDGKLGTEFLVLLGFLAGVALGTWYLVVVTRNGSKRGKPGSGTTGEDE